jgi:hypothetical protein
VKVYSRTCVKDAFIEATNGDRQVLKRGQKYTTDREINGRVMVFSTYWVNFPVELFDETERLEIAIRILKEDIANLIDAAKKA